MHHDSAVDIENIPASPAPSSPIHPLSRHLMPEPLTAGQTQLSLLLVTPVAFRIPRSGSIAALLNTDPFRMLVSHGASPDGRLLNDSWILSLDSEPGRADQARSSRPACTPASYFLSFAFHLHDALAEYLPLEHSWVTTAKWYPTPRTGSWAILGR